MKINKLSYALRIISMLALGFLNLSVSFFDVPARETSLLILALITLIFLLSLWLEKKSKDNGN